MLYKNRKAPIRYKKCILLCVISAFIFERKSSMKKCIIVLIVLLVFSYGDWILSTEAAPASIAKQISVPGDYQKISDAVHDGVPTGNNEWILIKVAPGVYT